MKVGSFPIRIVFGALLFEVAISQAGVATIHNAIAPMSSTGGADQYRVYVTNEGSGDVTVIDGPTRSVISTWPLGKRPRGISASPDGRYLYVALSGSPVAGPGVDEHSLPPPDKTADGVGVVDTDDGKLVRVIRGISDPEQIAVGRDGSRLYIASEDTGKALTVDAPTGHVLVEIDVGAEPEGVAISPDGSLACITSEVRNSVSILDTRTNRVIGQVPVGERPREVAFAPNGSKAYVTGESDASLITIDVGALKVEKRIRVPGDHPRPKGVVVSGDGRHLYVTTGRGGSLIAFDALTLKPLGSVSVGARPWGVALSPDGRFAYTANGPSNNVSVVDTDTMKVIATIDVGARPWGIAVVRR